VSPLEAAKRVDVPVLLVHGALDASTPPADSQRLGEALHAKGRVYIVPGAAHEEILDAPSAPVWTEIAAFLDGVAGAG
jgi:pimeloyl-ACP methyl ester carboxylesterase